MDNISASKCILKDVDHYRIVDPWFEGVRILLSYLGESYSPAYIQGISGGAFKISGPCPCAPTNGNRFEPQDLARLFGYEAELLPLYGTGIDTEKAVGPLINRIKDELRAVRPALLWHAFTFAEWDVVAGFDENEVLFFGRGSYRGQEDYAAEDMKRTLTSFDICPPLGALLIGKKSGSFDAGTAEREALQWAVQHARTPADRLPFSPGDPAPEWKFRNGLGCYDWWIASYRSQPDKIPDFGERYCLGVYQSTHRAATAFCLELANKYPRSAAHFEQAASAFQREAGYLQSLFDLLFPGFQIPSATDLGRSERAAVILSHAQVCYQQGIDSIECALAG